MCFLEVYLDLEEAGRIGAKVRARPLGLN